MSWATLQTFGIDDNGVYTIGLQVDDGNGGIDTTTTTITVNNVAPTGSADSGAAFTTDENTAFTTGDATANDTDPADANDPLTITGINVTGTLGTVTINADNKSFDYDPNGAFESLRAGQQATDTFTYVVDDGDGDTATSILVTITINGVNDQPTVIMLDNTSVAENAGGSVIGNLTTTDIDTGDSHTYTVDDARFAIVAGQLKLKAGQSLDFETEQTVAVVVMSTDSGGLQTNQSFTITVLDQNDNSPVVTPSQSFNVAETAANGVSLGTLAATDADAGTTLTSWTITGGNTDGIFAINSTTGELTVSDNTNLDFETTTGYTLRITVSDGTNTSTVETISITLTDTNDNSPVLAPGQSFNVLDTAVNGSLAGTVNATDNDVTSVLQAWTITAGDTDGVFTINPLTGQLTIVDDTTLDGLTTPMYALSLQVGDGVNQSPTQTVIVNVTPFGGLLAPAPQSETPSTSEDESESTTRNTAGTSFARTERQVDSGIVAQIKLSQTRH